MPDITGSIQHSLACLECVTREFTGDTKSTLGELMKNSRELFQPHLTKQLLNLGVAWNQGGHFRRAEAPEYLEAELVVEVTSAIATYLGKKFIAESTNLTKYF